MYEKSLVIIKPDGVKRRLAGRVLQRFEDAGLKLHALRLATASREKAEELYAEHKGKGFFPGVVNYLCGGPIVVMVLGGLGAISKIRTLIGATEPATAAPGTIRGDFAHKPLESAAEPQQGPLYNVVHASANSADAQREIALWFAPAELLEYPAPDDIFHA